MIDAIIVIGLCIGLLFATWTVGCLILKGMFKIADKIFGFGK